LTDDEWPIVGHSDVHDKIIAHLWGGRGKAGLLTGPKGSGKTKLVESVADAMGKTDHSIISVRATSISARIPMGAFAALLPNTLPTEKDITNEPALMLACALDSIRTAALAGPLVIIVDDVDYLDDLSLILVQQVVETRSASVLATRDSDNLGNDRLHSLWSSGVGRRFDIYYLDRRALTQILATVLAGVVDDAAVVELAQRSQGNLTIFRELVSGGLHTGVLAERDGVWRLSGEFVATNRLIELVERQLDDLSDDARGMLEMVALGEPMTIDELRIIGCETTAQALETGGFLSVATTDNRVEVSIAQPVHADILRSQIPYLRRMSMVRDLAAIRHTLGTPGWDIVRTASWHLMYGDGNGDAQLYLDGAVRVRWNSDFRLAEKLVRAALAAGAGLKANILLAELLGLQGRSKEASIAFARLSSQATTDDVRRRLALVRFDTEVHSHGFVQANASIADDVHKLATDTEWWQEIEARRSAVTLAEEGPAAALAVTESLIEGDSSGSFAWASSPASYSHARAGRSAKAIHLADRGYAAQLALPERRGWYPWIHLFNRCEALSVTGRFIEAEKLARDQYQLGLDSGSTEQQAMFAWQMSKFAADTGNIERSLRYSTMAIAIYRELDRPQFVEFTLIHQATALALNGKARQARAAMDTRDELGIEHHQDVEPEIALGWVAVAEHDFAVAEECFMRGVEAGLAIGDNVGALTALHAIARIGLSSSSYHHLNHHFAALEGDLAPARVAHIEALADCNADALDQISVNFEAMGAYLLAAESSADAAVAWLRKANKRRAAASRQRAHQLREVCKGAHTPALTDVVSRSQLTAGEHEAAYMAASGRTNKEIATSLRLSVRTVENRLQRAYVKLGIHGRDELGHALKL